MPLHPYQKRISMKETTQKVKVLRPPHKKTLKESLMKIWIRRKRVIKEEMMHRRDKV